MSDPAPSAAEKQPSDHPASASRRKQTRRSVLLTDRIASWTITIGGLMVILAVVGIMVFLVKVALPLAGGGESGDHLAYSLDTARPALWINTDEYATLGVRVANDGSYTLFHLPTGRTVAAGSLDFGGQVATVAGGTVERQRLAFGFEDGTVRFAELRFQVDVLLAGEVPPGLQSLDERDSVATDGSGALYRRIDAKQVRRVVLTAKTEKPQRVTDNPIIAIAYRVGGTTERPTRSFVTFDSKGVGRLSRTESKINMMTGKVRTRVRTSTLPALPQGTRVTALAMNTQADSVYVASANGEIFRFDTRDFNAPALSERVTAFPDGVTIGVMDFLVGEQSLVVGGSNGAVDVWFKVSGAENAAADGYKLVRARRHEPHGGAVIGFGASQRNKALVTEAANGEVWVRHSTSDQVLLRYHREGTSQAGSSLMLLPRFDGVLRVGSDGAVDYWRFDYPHPETTLESIFGEVWYEGYSEPGYTWQSSSGTDDFEPKFSLVPLIFGTLKATIYSLLFAIPIALLGAIYTSEFVHRKVRATVKPMMEMMESLPTVVMGFIGALILAPIVEDWVAAVMLAFIALPLGLMIAAYLWQLLPLDWALKLDGLPKLAFMLAVIAAASWFAYLAGPGFEELLFYGDFKAWTNGSVGSGTPFMFLVLTPLAFLLISWLFNRVLGTAYQERLRGLPKPKAGALDLARWAGLVIVAAAVSFLAASLLTALGYDPRGGVVDTYVQRNALVVGFVMGFAIIPNIYTLAEDALNSVPNHVRSASLAAGATPWQTAKWVILPTALSGVFAACMIGMGRAVGETMIVVMAAGNTPVLDWNIFNGLRTLSANIAVELPEAVQGGTLYRMLFLAALTLFAMTFAINTVAESIRMRFRRRAFQL
ncbi:MAG: hypothetical protein Kow006_00230 [Gammaproteobacteria bacterium]